MKEKEYNIDTFDAWLNNEMDTQERKDFQEKLDNDPTLFEALQNHKTLIESIEFSGEERLREKIKQTESELNRSKFFEKNQKTINMTQGNKNSGFRWVSIAASILLAGAAVMFYFSSEKTSSNPINPKEAFAQHYKPDSKIILGVLDRLEAPGLADPGTEGEDTLVMALKNYQNYKYKEARTLLSTYLDLNPENQTARFYMGLTQLQISNYAKAIDYLLPLCTEEGFANQDAAKWYLSMSYTQLEGSDGMSMAKKYLSDLAGNNGSDYQGNAKAYMDALNL